MKKIVMLGYLVLGSVSMAYGDQKELFSGQPSGDFIIRWAFQKACDHVFDPRTSIWVWPTSSQGVTFNPSKVQPGDCIFVRKVEQFFKELHPRIAHPYILVTHGERLDVVKESYLDYLNSNKVIAWFSIHPCKKKHPKFHPLPLGVLQDPSHYKKRESLGAFLTELRETTEKRHLVYMNFADENKPDRKKLKQYLNGQEFCKRGTRLPFFKYLKEMASCTFTLAPAGLGPDSYRVWEALLVGSIPVLKSSSIDPLLEDLPVLIVSKWSEITKEFLEKKYHEISSKKYNINKLYMEYWLAKIKKVQKRFLAEHTRKEGAHGRSSGN